MNKKDYSEYQHDVEMISSKSYVTLVFLSAFLGWWAVDRFYLGRIASGFLKLLLVWVWIGWIWVIVDFIMAVLEQRKDSKGLLVKR